MRLTRKKFVLSFLAVGFTYQFADKFLLSHPPEAIWASPDQAAWQRTISMILSPLKLVLMGPVIWLQQDPDPPPPFRLILLGIYWSLLALGIHHLLARRKADA
jgi:hypothetical protein